MRRLGDAIGSRLVVTVVAVVAGMLLSAPATADQVVYFLNGKAITVKKIEQGDRLTILEIEGGGRIGVPTAQIDRIEELQLSPPSAAVAAPQAAPAPAQNAIVPPAASESQAASGPTGPGFGGQAAQAAAGVPGPVPLSIPGSPAQVGTTPGPAVRPQPGMQPGANRQLGSRRNGGIAQPSVGLRRPGARGGSFRGRPPLASYQPPPASSERRVPERTGTADPQSADPDPSPAPDVEAGDPGVPPEESAEMDGDPITGAPVEGEVDAPDPAAEEDDDDPNEER